MNYVVNSRFSDIGNIRYGRTSSVTDKTLVRSGSSEFVDSDFFETDFKYLQNKISFSDPKILDYLDSTDKSSIGMNLEKVSKYSVTLFPTVLSGDSSGGNSYFSTYIDPSGNELICLVIPEEIKYVKLYEGSSNSVSISITFSDEETEFSKVLYLFMTYTYEEKKVLNISYISYLSDETSNREMSDYVLRNDSLVPDYKGYTEKEGYLYSCISGSLFGTEKLESRPIYDRVKSRNGNEWNREKRYSIGDKVMIGSTEYESIDLNNIGNHPYYSRSWIKSGILDSL